MQLPDAHSARRLTVWVALAACGVPVWASEGDAAGSGDTTPAARGLQALYEFRVSSGPIVKDTAGVGRPANLEIANLDAVRRTAGTLEVVGETVIRSSEPPARLIESIRQSGECTIEAWIRPANDQQQGPARIVTLSKSASSRNLTLGQDKNRFDVRLRTTKTSSNGLPSLSSREGTARTKLTHVVYTRGRGKRVVIFVDGKPAGRRNVAGRTTNWDRGYKLALANEFGGGRPWRGTYHRVAIYSRTLSPQEVAERFRSGLGEDRREQQLAAEAARQAAHHFETRIAPVLAEHCLECHDAFHPEGKFDLSRRESAFAGGENGVAITPGEAAESFLWDLVEADEMPHDRPPLSADEKTLLRDWINSGATWTLDRIDPAVYVHAGRDTGNWIRRLTVEEYVETVRAVTGVDIEPEARRILPPDIGADGFKNTAYNLGVDLKHIQGYAELAGLVAGRVDAKAFARKFTKSRRLTDKNMRALVGDMGKWILRGPLDGNEIDVYRGISTTVMSAGGHFEEAVRYILEAMLQSPRFIYRIERQRGDGTLWPVGQYELASRISYLVWGGPPDEALIRDADAGRLDRNHAAHHVERMLQDPRAVTQSNRFVSQWLKLDRLEHLQPDREHFGDWDPTIADDMRRETVAFAEELIWRQQRPLADLLNAQVTFVTPRLARHYGLKLPDQESTSEGELVRVELGDVPARGGLLTHGSTLTVGGDEASMVTRGLFVFHELLRGVVKDPPPCVDTTPIPSQPGRPQRSIAEQRIADRSCGGCHSKFEPLAFGLEKFDGLGRYHEHDEYGNTLRDDGEIVIVGAARPVAFESSAELMNRLAESDRAAETITWKLTQFAVGRPLAAADARQVAQIHAAAREHGGTYASLLQAIARSDLVHMTLTEPDS